MKQKEESNFKGMKHPDSSPHAPLELHCHHVANHQAEAAHRKPAEECNMLKFTLLHPTFWPSLHQAICQKMNVLECGKEPSLFHGPGHMQKINVTTNLGYCLVNQLSICELKVPRNSLANTKTDFNCLNTSIELCMPTDGLKLVKLSTTTRRA